MASGRVLIIGGGVAGISAAVAAIRKGLQPVLVEKNHTLGGRARSLYARDIRRTIDNGQHALSYNYQHTRWLLTTLNSLDRVHFQKRLEILFYLSHHRRIHFRVWNLPSPFHLLLPLLILLPLTPADRKFLVRWGWMNRNRTEQQLKPMTVREWLYLAGDAPVLEQVFWTPLTLAALNTPIEKASALLLHRALNLAFLSGAAQSGLGLPADMLDEIFANPAEQFIRSRGGEVLTGTAIEKINFADGRVVSATTGQGKILEAGHFVLATSPSALLKILHRSEAEEEKWWKPFDQFQYSPIITINFWTRQPLPPGPPVALVNSPLQWIFPIPEHGNSGEGYGYTGVISAAFREVDWERKTLMEMIDREFVRFFKQSLVTDLHLLDSKIIKERTATILQTPDSLRLRPGGKTPYPNLVLAGDWLDTGLPATIESAVQSGREAIDKLTG